MITIILPEWLLLSGLAILVVNTILSMILTVQKYRLGKQQDRLEVLREQMSESGAASYAEALKDNLP